MVFKDYSWQNTAPEDYTAIDTEMQPYRAEHPTKREMRDFLLPLHDKVIGQTGIVRLNFLQNRTRPEVLMYNGTQAALRDQAEQEGRRMNAAWNSIKNQAVYANHSSIAQLGSLIDGSNYERAPAEKIAGMSLVFAVMKRDSLHPVERAALLQAMIERVQPLRTGNKRLERLLANKLLLDADLPAFSAPLDLGEYGAYEALLGAAAKPIEFGIRGNICYDPETFAPFARLVAANIYGNIGELPRKAA